MNQNKWLGVCGGLAFALVASAQGAPDDPASPTASAPPLRYQSAFAGFRAFDDAGIGSWKAVNDRVREAAAQTPGNADHGGAPAMPHGGTPASAAPADGRSHGAKR